LLRIEDGIDVHAIIALGLLGKGPDKAPRKDIAHVTYFNEWDNKNLWSGCVARKDNTFYIYYTGENSNPSVSNIQKIGVAISKDLNIWTKYDKNPILEADPRYYQMDNNKNVLGNVGAWRDPFVFKDQYSDSRYMTISARENTKGIKYNACVALAQSDDMINWNILPPIFSPGIYDEIEVTRIIYHNGYYYLFFTTYGRNYEPEFAKQHGAHDGLHCYYSDNLFGGYKPINGNGVVFDNVNCPTIGAWAPTTAIKHIIIPVSKKVILIGDSSVYGTGASNLAHSFASLLVADSDLSGFTWVMMPGDATRQLGIYGTTLKTMHYMAQEFAVSESPDYAILLGYKL